VRVGGNTKRKAPLDIVVICEGDDRPQAQSRDLFALQTEGRRRSERRSPPGARKIDARLPTLVVVYNLPHAGDLPQAARQEAEALRGVHRMAVQAQGRAEFARGPPSPPGKSDAAVTHVISFIHGGLQFGGESATVLLKHFYYFLYCRSRTSVKYPVGSHFNSP